MLFEYFVVFILIWYAGKATLFVVSIESWEYITGLMLPIISVLILAILKGVQFNYKFWLLILGFTLYFIASTVKFGELHPRFYLINIIKISIVYIVISALRFKMFKIYEEILYVLCIVGLTFWLIQNIIPEVFIELLRNFEFSRQPEPKANVDFNMIIYTVNNFEVAPDHIIELGSIKIFRNPGFAWEPGAFATYINVAIFFNLIRNKFRLKNNKHFWVFLVALASTFSTTGYSILILFALFYVYNQNLVQKVWLVPIIVLTGMLLFTLPFMTNKITKEPTFTTDQMIYYSAKYKNAYSPQRIQSLQIDIIDFLNHPLIGYGGHDEVKWTKQLGAQIATVSGIGKIMAQFGIVGIIFFIISLWRSSKQIITLYNIKGTIFPFLLILLISVSYSVLNTIFMFIWLLHFSSFLKTEVLRRYTAYTILKKIESPESHLLK